MSFSVNVKLQAIESAGHRPCCMLSELSALTCLGGSYAIGGGGSRLTFKTEQKEIAQRYIALVKGALGYRSSLFTAQRQRLGKPASYHVAVEGDELAGAMLEKCGINMLEKAVPAGLLRDECCRRAYLRGLYLAAGTASDIEKGYHIEIALPGEIMAWQVIELLDGFGVSAKYTQRRDSFVVYIKDSRQIASLLSVIGAYESVLALENQIIYKNITNNVNRVMNCENANVERTLDASARQVDDINFLISAGKLNSLSEPLIKLAQLRIENPEAPYSELGQMLSPPISKSAVNNRLRKIAQISQKYQEEGTMP